MCCTHIVYSHILYMQYTVSNIIKLKSYKNGENTLTLSGKLLTSFMLNSGIMIVLILALYAANILSLTPPT